MSVIEQFKGKSYLLKERLHELNDLLYNMQQEFIKHDLVVELVSSTILNNGSNKLTSYDWIDEVIINGKVFTLINKAKQSYKGYEVYTKKDYNIIGLGFKYKKDIVSPHISLGVDKILEKYNEQEILEITQLIERELIKIEEDINYLNQNKNINLHKYYYKNYDGLFEGDRTFQTISDVIADFKS